MNKKIKAVYIEDMRMVREAVNFLLSHQGHLEIIDEQPEPGNISEFVSIHRPNVAIIDLQLTIGDPEEKTNGFTVAEEFKKADPSIKLVAHSIYDSVENVNRFFAAGGTAFVSKKSGHIELLAAITSVSEGRQYLCSAIRKQTKNADRFIHRDDEQLKAIKEIFTKTEKNVLERIAKGYSTKQIAHQLGVSEKTVETHRKHLFDKAGVKNVAELIAFVFSRRIVME